MNKKIKPKCKLLGKNGYTISSLLAIARRTLERAGMEPEAEEMTKKVKKSGSYHEALVIIDDYVEIC